MIFVAGCAAPKPQTAIPLPAFNLGSTINVADGVDEREAGFIAAAYLARYVSLCGMPKETVLDGDVWVTKLGVGYIPACAGKLRISRMTGDVVYEPRRNRFTDFDMEMLRLRIARTEKERSAAH